MTEAPDDILLRAYTGGDGAALAVLAARHERSMLGLALGLVGGRRDLAMDAVQETWVRVIRFAAGFEGRSSVKTWLYTILINQCRSIRAARRAGPLPESIPAGAVAEGATGEDRLHTALDALGEAPREIILLCYHAGVTHETAAEVLGVPVGTVKSRLHAALKALRGALAPEAAS